MVRIPVGSKQHLRVTVTDKTGTLTTLTGTSPRFDVKEGFTPFGTKYTDQAATSSGMVGLCLIDTAGWTLGEYRLWFEYTVGAEEPRLGPMTFLVTP